jgi:hypothetical protein
MLKGDQEIVIWKFWNRIPKSSSVNCLSSTVGRRTETESYGLETDPASKLVDIDNGGNCGLSATFNHLAYFFTK